MNTTVYAVSLVLHVAAAAAWIGGLLFLVFVLVPGLRGLDDPRLRAQLIRVTGIRFRLVGWICMGVLLFSGAGNLIGRGIGPEAWVQPAFWQAGYGRMLAWKLGLFLLLLSLSALHDWIIGPRAGAAQRAHPGSPEALKLRRMATGFGRFNLLLSLALLVLGILLSRGLTG
ncbi:MAG TPA: CopD family protein [Kiritimatiellia bacterium]|nr:CopD family protein [Kiritimatiellia bacterium]